MIQNIGERYRKLLAVAAAAKALKGDLDARDESPTHFSSWFILTEALGDLDE